VSSPARWDPAVYELFKAERARPFRDLLALLKRRPGLRVVDLGCGTGETTRELHAELGAVRTLGLDSSPEMLDRARSLAGGGLSFELGSIESFEPAERFDVVFSNAALHWVEDHRALFAGLRRLLADGGQLAVQMPAMDGHHPSHTVAAEVAQEEPFGLAPRVSPLLPLDDYASLLFELGARDAGAQLVRMQIYAHPLPSRDDVVTWVSGSLLTDYQKRLTPELFEGFLERYRERLREQLPPDHPYLYCYRRVLLWGKFA